MHFFVWLLALLLVVLITGGVIGGLYLYYYTTTTAQMLLERLEVTPIVAGFANGDDHDFLWSGAVALLSEEERHAVFAQIPFSQPAGSPPFTSPTAPFYLGSSDLNIALINSWYMLKLPSIDFPAGANSLVPALFPPGNHNQIAFLFSNGDTPLDPPQYYTGEFVQPGAQTLRFLIVYTPGS